MTSIIPKRTDSNSSESDETVKESLMGNKKEDVKLKREVGLLGGVAFIVGTIIGSGIFITPTGVPRGTGSVGLSLVVWTLCGVLAMGGGLCYAELGTLIHKSGGEYAYLKEAFGNVPAFLYAWITVTILKPSSLAVICLTCAEYIASLVYDTCDPPVVAVKLICAVAITLIVFINCFSVKLATKVQSLFMFMKLSAMAIIIVGGIVMLAQGMTENISTGFDGTLNNPSKIALSFYSGLFAYDGWNNLNYMVEEVKDPKKNLPLSIIIGIPIVIICYICVNISYFTVLPVQEIITSNAVGMSWARVVLGPAFVIIPLSVAFSTFGSANGSCFTAARISMVAARDENMPLILSTIHIRRYTPAPALLLNGLIAIIMIIPGNIFGLIDFFSFTAWISYAATFLALIVMRKTKRDEERIYKVPIPIPIFMFLASSFLVIAPIVNEPRIEFLYASLFTLAGLLFYIPFVSYKLHLRVFDKFTHTLQKLLEVTIAHEEKSDD